MKRQHILVALENVFVHNKSKIYEEKSKHRNNLIGH